ncbi:MAG: hypothetical protein GX806_02610, partial [Lentisphaerae bacterium]|nr:hypothetical protein [Lentisphaerota bacterium]
MSALTSNRQAGLAELRGIVLLTLSALMILALVSYRWEDIALLKVPPNDPPLNYIGPVGAWFAFLSLMTLGFGAFLLPLLGIALGLGALRRASVFAGRRLAWGGLSLLLISGLLALHALGWELLGQKFNLLGLPGGLGGWLLARRGLEALLGKTGASVLLSGLLAGSLIMFIGRPLLSRCFQGLCAAGRLLRQRLRALLDARRDQLAKLAREERALAKQISRQEKSLRRRPERSTP